MDLSKDSIAMLKEVQKHYGTKWLARNYDDTIMLFTHKPHRVYDWDTNIAYWESENSKGEVCLLDRPETRPLCDLVEYGDKPFSVEKALKLWASKP